MAQPIAIEDLLRYLVFCLDHPADGNRVYEIGGPDQVSYRDLMREYARQHGLGRTMISVPFLSPRLPSLWLGLVTPLYARVERALIESIRNPTLVHDTTARDNFDQQPMGVAAAVSRAIVNEDREFAATRCSDAQASAGSQESWAGVRLGNRLIDHRHVRVKATEAQAFAPVVRIGADRGWYFATWLWVLRGWLDLLPGGEGPTPAKLRPANSSVPHTHFASENRASPEGALRQSEFAPPHGNWISPKSLNSRRSCSFGPLECFLQRRHGRNPSGRHGCPRLAGNARASQVTHTARRPLNSGR